MTSLRELLEEKDRLRDLPGWQVRKALMGLSRSRGIFEGNTRQLQAFLGAYDQAAGTIETFDLSNPAQLEKFYDETDRLLHNFLAAAASLRDHATRIQREHLAEVPGDADSAECTARETAFADSPVGAFVTVLRNHVLHDRIPETDGYLLWSLDPVEVTSGIKLDGPSLLAAREWGKRASRYIEDAGDDILIHEVVAEYHDVAIDFYAWFDVELRRRNQAALDELDTKADDVGRRLREAWGSPVEDPAGGSGA